MLISKKGFSTRTQEQEGLKLIFSGFSQLSGQHNISINHSVRKLLQPKIYSSFISFSFSADIGSINNEVLLERLLAQELITSTGPNIQHNYHIAIFHIRRAESNQNFIAPFVTVLGEKCRKTVRLIVPPMRWFILRFGSPRPQSGWLMVLLFMPTGLLQFNKSFLRRELQAKIFSCCAEKQLKYLMYRKKIVKEIAWRKFIMRDLVS